MESRPPIVRSRIGTRLVHPGQILLEEFMRPFWISQNALARRIGVSPRRINEIVNGKRSITAATALGLGEALGPSAHFWMALQADYDLELAMARQMNATRLEHKPLPEIERSYDLEEEGLDVERRFRGGGSRFRLP